MSDYSTIGDATQHGREVKQLRTCDEYLISLRNSWENSHRNTASCYIALEVQRPQEMMNRFIEIEPALITKSHFYTVLLP